MKAPVIRISIGRFDAGLTPTVEVKVNEMRARIEGGVRALKGNLGFCAGIDKKNGAMHNVSFWESVADAEQMSTFAPMLQLGREFAAIGVSFERPILNCDTLWQWD
jgi:hypothetical protein